VIGHADIRRVQEWMGHADVQTTMRYLHDAPRHDDAALVARAFGRTPVPMSVSLRSHRDGAGATRESPRRS
jgi:hypothetical protein